MPDFPSRPITFAGEFLHSLDDKHRVTIPSAWRTGEGDVFFVIPNEKDQFLTAVAPHHFEAEKERILQNPELSSEERQFFAHHFYANAREVALDKQGRLLLADEHYRKAGLEKEAMLVGNHNKFQIWQPARYAKFAEERSAVIRSLSKRMLI